MSSARRLAHDLKWKFHRTFDAYQDRRLGIDASGLHQKEELGSTGPHAMHSYVYLGTPHLVLDLAFRRLRIDPRRFIFVDLGSGKGRVLLRAALRPFKRVEGVELSPKLHEATLENLEKAKASGSLCSPVIARNEDAVEYKLPEAPLVLFFFNAFERVVLNKFLDRLEDSLREQPRDCYFIYVNPRNGDCIEQRPFMQAMPMSRPTRMLIRLLSPWPLALYRSATA
jgi:SAM-dependent methyltransferase